VLLVGFASAAQDPATLFHALGTFSSPYLPFQRFGFIVLLIWQLNSAAVVSLYGMATLSSLKVQVFPLTPWAAVAGVGLSAFALSYTAMAPDVYAIAINDWSIAGLILFFAAPALLVGLGRQVRRQLVRA
jgi:hypothetical protein